ncbi:MAG: nucleotidyltransferase domain-containing protein [Nanoarchaeota archaeon]
MITKILPLSKNKLIILNEIINLKQASLTMITKSSDLNKQVCFDTLNQLKPILKIQEEGRFKLYEIIEIYLEILKPIIYRFRLENIFSKTQLDTLDLVISTIYNSEVYLYGSYVKKNTKKDSDLDILVITDEEVPEIKSLFNPLRILFKLDLKFFTTKEIEKLNKVKKGVFYDILNNKREHIKLK